MKTLAAITFLLALVLMGSSPRDAAGATTTAAARAGAPVQLVADAEVAAPDDSIPPGKRARIRELMELIGTTALMRQMLANGIESFKLVSPQVPPEFWTAFQEKSNIDELVEVIVPIYARHFSQAELDELVLFYKTPLGAKLVAELPAIMQESNAAGSAWGARLGQKIAEEMTKRGYQKPD